ncbi:MAG TPA: ABC transporter ATP-binding protein [Candidatus Humimicrobiaceae bacterium]|nr:ABC transporter ATP-binding protein [Candidatus Humimicrobiaceae bacterium]
MNKAVIQVKNLKKSYGKIKAVDDISFEIYEQEIFGLVGPNGAGKTTAIECIEGLRKPNSGDLMVLDLNPTSNGRALRNMLGIQLQESQLPARIKVWEAMSLFSSFYKKNIESEPLLKDLGLEEKKKSYFDKLSGGQKQRLFIALSLINDPQLIFLDELTTGLDPQARRTTWDLINSVRERGKTIFLTTHSMEEAERLCDRVAIMDKGKIIALDTPGNLIRNISTENRVMFSVTDGFDLETLSNIRSISKYEKSGNRITIYGHDKRMVKDVVNFLVNRNIDFYDLQTQQSTLEDVFLALTGKKIRN